MSSEKHEHKYEGEWIRVTITRVESADVEVQYCKCGVRRWRNIAPIRIQRKRIKGWRIPENTVYVGRPTKWGNPFKVTKKRGSREEAIGKYKEMLKIQDVYPRNLDYSELKGKNLACWCRLDQICHADILLELANK